MAGRPGRRCRRCHCEALEQRPRKRGYLLASNLGLVEEHRSDGCDVSGTLFTLYEAMLIVYQNHIQRRTSQGATDSVCIGVPALDRRGGQGLRVVRLRVQRVDGRATWAQKLSTNEALQVHRRKGMDTPICLICAHLGFRSKKILTWFAIPDWRSKNCRGRSPCRKLTHSDQ